MNNMENVVGYARTSTSEVHNHREQNIETQIKELKDMSIDTSHIFFDEGISGDVPADDRQGFQGMLKYVWKNDITWVYTFEISRIGRTYYDTLETLIKLEKSGIRIVSLSPNESWTKIEDPAMRGVFISFYDALAENGSAVEQLGDDQLKLIASELVDIIHKNTGVDWTSRKAVKAKLRLKVKKLLKKYKYPPDQQKAAIDLVLKQASASAEEFVSAA